MSYPLMSIKAGGSYTVFRKEVVQLLSLKGKLLINHVLHVLPMVILCIALGHQVADSLPSMVRPLSLSTRRQYCNRQ